MPTIIDIDSYKEKIPGYNPNKAGDVHTESAKMADQEFRLAITEKPKKYKKVIFLCGGSATGKTEFIKNYFKNEPNSTLIFDSTFSGEQGMKSKLSKVKNKFDEVFVVLIQPADMISAFITFMSRNRKFHHNHFIKTHSGSRFVALKVLENYPMEDFRYFVSSLDEDKKMIFTETTSDRDSLLELVKSEQITEDELEGLINPFIKLISEYEN